MKFCSSGEKMSNANGNRGEKNDSEKKKKKKRSYDISSINRVTGKFLEVSRCSRAKQRQRNGHKKCRCCTCKKKLLFLLIRPIVVFSPFSLPSPLSITGFYILFEQTINTIKSFALALTKSVYYSVSN